MTENGFGLRLRELRTAAGLTQPALAGLAGLSKNGVAQIEQGQRSPTWDTVLALAGALGVPLETFRATPAAGAKPAGPGRPRKGRAGQ